MSLKRDISVVEGVLAEYPSGQAAAVRPFLKSDTMRSKAVPFTINKILTESLWNPHGIPIQSLYF